jgi:hypothetical protein
VQHEIPLVSANAEMALRLTYARFAVIRWARKIATPHMIKKVDAETSYKATYRATKYSGMSRPSVSAVRAIRAVKRRR